MSNLPKKNWMWLPESQLVRNKITHRYMIKGDYDHDALRFGFWVNPESKTYTLLSLKGCRFKGTYNERLQTITSGPTH